MAWTTISFPFGSILTSAKMTQLYDNFAALANGDSGAPNVQTAGIANDAVTGAKIADNAIALNHMTNNSVDTAELVDDSVTSAKIANGAINNNAFFGSNVIAQSQLQSNCVGNAQMQSNAIGNAECINGSIGTEKFQTGTTERDWVLARTSGAAHGAVGTYAFVQNATGTSIGTGATTSGSNLLWSRVLSSGGTSGFGTPSGTWRIMGRGIAGSDATVALRVS